MHPAAAEWVEQIAKRIEPPEFVIDQGGRNINGSIKQYFPTVKKWVSVDITDGEGVDVVADAASFVILDSDLVVSTELFEHTPKVPQIIQCAYNSLKYNRHYIITTAGPNRPPHNAHGLEQLEEGEYYQNIDPYWLMDQLRQVGFIEIVINVREDIGDVRAWCIK